MTLCLTLSTSKYICQVSDRRLVRITPYGSNELYTDQANKSTIFNCSQAVAAITYVGIGEALGKRTDDWLVDVLKPHEVQRMPIIQAMDHLCEKATNWLNRIKALSKLTPNFCQHSFVAATLVKGYPTVFLVSNFESLKSKEQLDEPWDDFRGTFFRPTPGSEKALGILAHGVHGALSQEYIEKLSQAGQAMGARPEDLINLMVGAIRDASKRSKLIGRNCMSTLLMPGVSDVLCKYHPTSGGSTIYAPNLIQGFVIKDFEFYTGSGTPQWRIREKLPVHLTKQRVIAAMGVVAAAFRTGDTLPTNLDREVAAFLSELDPGISEKEILDAL